MQSIYKQRRDALMAALGSNTAMFASAPMAVMHNDVEYTFRQDSDFYYLTGFNEPGAIAILAPHHEEHQFVLFVRPKDKAKETWSGRRLGVEAAKEQLGADAVFPINELDEKLPGYLKGGGDRLYYHFGHDKAFNSKVLRHWQQLLGRYVKRGTGPIAIEDSRLLLQSMRRIKSAEELELIRKAVAVSVKAHNHAREIAQPGRYEYEIQAEMEHLFKLAGGGPAYPSIVASGDNACILHYVENTRQMQAGDLLLIDAGGCIDYYNADITRTFPVAGKFSEEQRIIYELVLEAQLQAIAEVKPGNPFNAFHDAAVRTITEGLVELGLLTGDVDKLIEEKKHQAFFMHGTGHFLGLDVHDSGILRNPDKTWKPFATGNVVTVEPGIYISPDYEPEEGQPQVEARWRGIGVRIEDDVLVTETGCDVLTAGVPKALADMEA
ncbi:MAG: aminopeptidase P N-terminal domain-containing protein [Leptolyngbyaceae cyanobacterium]